MSAHSKYNFNSCAGVTHTHTHKIKEECAALRTDSPAECWMNCYHYDGPEGSNTLQLNKSKNTSKQNTVVFLAGVLLSCSVYITDVSFQLSTVKIWHSIKQWAATHVQQGVDDQPCWKDINQFKLCKLRTPNQNEWSCFPIINNKLPQFSLKLPELDVRNMSVVVVEVYINKDAE